MSKSLHWYDGDGKAVHTQPTTSATAKSPTRPTTVKDALKHGLYPSVTSKIGIIDNYQLNDWKQREVIKTASLNPQRDGEPDEAYSKRVIDAAFEQVSDAADLGTAIHEALELHFTGADYNPMYSPYVQAVDKWVTDNKVTFEAHELRLVNKAYGYAGTTDAAFRCPKGYGIMDFKSKRTKVGEKVTNYDSHLLQIAAYHQAHFQGFESLAIGCNLYISTTEVGRVEAVWYNDEDLRAAWGAFKHASELWDYIKGYKAPTT